MFATAAMVLVTAGACSGRNDPAHSSGGNGGAPVGQSSGGASAGGGNGAGGGPGGAPGGSVGDSGGGGGPAGQGGLGGGGGGGFGGGGGSGGAGGAAPGFGCDPVFKDGGAIPNIPGGNAQIALANLTGGGKRELVVADQIAVRTFANDGAGHFVSLGTYPTTVPSLDIATGDLNGDGLADVAVVRGLAADQSFAAPLPVGVFLNRGDGTLAPEVSYPLPVGATAVAIGDLDGDHLPDLVVSGVSTYLLLNQGGGTFRDAQALATDGGRPALADLDGDGKVDLALAVPSVDKVEVLLNQGALVFAPPRAVTFDTRFPSLGIDARSLMATDLNGDGAADLVVLGRVPMVDQGQRSLAIAFNDGTGVFSPGYGTQIPQDDGALAVGDFDGDGRVDLAVTSVATLAAPQGGITALVARSGATYTVAVCPTILGSLASSISAMVGGDLNGDGRADLVVARPDGVGVLFSTAP